ncbi:hypothetical protein GLOIN_2v1773489 [Rhizophagus clarus]|uniref:Uncharacterized protein n=1 Tax=Rhizophagus clarus TaxID=94130 RepID=A0A8H3LHR1_9GLOM|nr:hypothetical protein GLOIN_2v1773489 [Rhizophagus clarus]
MLETNIQMLTGRKDTHIAEHRRTAHRLTVRYNNDTEHWRRRHAGCVRQAQNWKGQYRNSQNQVQARDQNILNLQGQILALQNNPLGNMAAVHEIYQILFSSLVQIPNYTGQYTPDEYIQKVTNVFESAGAVITAANNANANTFIDAQKCDILKSKMGDKFSPVPANDPYTNANPAINSPTTFTVWLRHKYREVMAGNAELALQSLIQERFNPTDSPNIYESRVRKHIVGFADDQVLPALYTHLPLDLRNSVKIYMTIRSAGHQTIDNFFADLRKYWVERQAGPSLFPQSVTMGNQIQPQVINSQGVTSAEIKKLNSKIASLEAQLAESMQVHSKLAQHLQLPENVVNSNNTSIFDSHINQELEKRLGVIEINLAKLTKLVREDIIDTKSTQCSEFSDYNNGGLEKRLERIEAHVAKFARKDTRGAKTPQRQRSESLPF